jgi:hypothetical protein
LASACEAIRLTLVDRVVHLIKAFGDRQGFEHPAVAFPASPTD